MFTSRSNIFCGMKNKRCYGRQNIVVPKEKSFITNFFDGNKSSDISVFHSSSDEEDKKDGFIKDKGKKLDGILDSPVLFHDFSHENISLHQNVEKENIKVNQVFKKGKCAKRNKQVKKKKPYGIQYLSTKYCKSLQPNWSEFSNYNLTIERPERRCAIPARKHNSIQENIVDFTSCKPTEKIITASNGRQNIRKSKVNDKENCHDETRTSVCKKLRANFLSCNSLNSSGELFIQPTKKKSLKKKRTNKYPARDKNAEGIIIGSELEKKMNHCMELVSQNSYALEIVSNTDNILFDKVISSDFEINPTQSLNPPPTPNILKISEDNEKIPNSVLGSSKNQVSSSNIDPLSLYGNHSVPNDIVHKSFAHKNSQNESNNFLDVSIAVECLESVGNLKKGVEEVNVSSDRHHSLDLLKISSDLVHSKNVSKIINPVNQIENYSPKSSEHFSTPIKLSAEDDKFSKEKSTHHETSILKEKMLESFISNVNRCHNLKSFDNSKTNLLHVIENTVNNDTSNIAQNWNSNKKSKNKFTTSTPVSKTVSECLHPFTIEKLSLLCNKINESISGGKHIEDEYLKCSDCNKINSISLNLSKCLPSDNTVKSLQFDVCLDLLKSKKSLTLPSRNSFDSTGLNRRHQSLVNLSSSKNVQSAERVSGELTKAKLLKLCEQDSVVAFADIYDWKKLKVTKIGEGSYGEVFVISKGKISSVLKVIPISEDDSVKNVQDFSSIYSEVKISKSLSELRNNKQNQSKNFIKVIRSSIVSGSYPDVLLKAWDDFSIARSTYNHRPDLFKDNQLFAILELEYGGKDMSCFVLKNAVEAESILKQIAVSLAIAEEEYSFEHRDLHLGNILVKRSRAKKVSYKLRGNDISFQCHGLKVTIIDFTLSLLSENGFIYYFDLADDVSLFEQTGDFQFDVYKSMRRNLENKWEDCTLYSNVLWLKYLCQKMKEHKYSCPTSIAHKKSLKAIDSFNSYLMECSCALECLEKYGITSTIYQRAVSSVRKKSILVSRNSLQKSKSSMCD